MINVSTKNNTKMIYDSEWDLYFDNEEDKRNFAQSIKESLKDVKEGNLIGFDEFKNEVKTWFKEGDKL